jgi:GTPase
MTALCPDFAMIVIGANMGITRMTKEHMGIALSLNIPFFVVVSKIDLCPENIYKENIQNLIKLLKSGSVNRMPMMMKGSVNDLEEISKCAKS